MACSQGGRLKRTCGPPAHLREERWGGEEEAVGDHLSQTGSSGGLLPESAAAAGRGGARGAGRGGARGGARAGEEAAAGRIILPQYTPLYEEMLPPPSAVAPDLPAAAGAGGRAGSRARDRKRASEEEAEDESGYNFDDDELALLRGGGGDGGRGGGRDGGRDGGRGGGRGGAAAPLPPAAAAEEDEEGFDVTLLVEWDTQTKILWSGGVDLKEARRFFKEVGRTCPWSKKEGVFRPQHSELDESFYKVGLHLSFALRPDCV
jgi:hypothetical protein